MFYSSEVRFFFYKKLLCLQATNARSFHDARSFQKIFDHNFKTVDSVTLEWIFYSSVQFLKLFQLLTYHRVDRDHLKIFAHF